MKRRDFLRTAGCGTLGLIASGYLPRGNAAELTADNFMPLFASDDPEVLKLTETIYRKCILGKVYPPEEPLKHNWIAPGGVYRGQWIWDTMFVVDLLSIIPGKEKVIRDVFQNYWDFQTRWNAVRPAFAHDMISCAIYPGKDRKSAQLFSQIPILAWGVERVYRRNGDKELLKQCLGPLERFHEWYWRERDLTNIGLVTVGAYVDKDNAWYPDPVQAALVKHQWDHYENLSILLKNKHLHSQAPYSHFTPSNAIIPLLS